MKKKEIITITLEKKIFWIIIFNIIKLNFWLK
jgi:hypothetical protein